MVNSKKMSKSSIAVIVLSILLVLSMIIGLTGAWFTDKETGSQNDLKFGKVDIAWEASGAFAVTSTNTIDTTNVKLMPGSTLAFTGTIDNTKDEAWVGYQIVMTFGPEVDFAGVTLPTGWTASGAAAVKNVLTFDGKVTKVATTGKVDLSTIASVVVPTATPNAAAETTLAIEINIAAIQTANTTATDWDTYAKIAAVAKAAKGSTTPGV